MFTEEQLQELKRCKEDPIYFINNYVKFTHFRDGLIPFELYEKQEKLINKYHKNRFNILKASRQVGKSSTALYYILHHIIFEDYRTVGIFSFHRNPSIDLLDQLKVSYENLPEWMKHKVISNNKQTLELENGSRVIAASVSPSSIKKQTFSIILLDEIGNATYSRIEEFFITIYPIIFGSEIAKVIINSSKDYYEKSYFNKIWKESEEGKNDFVRTTIKWNDIPGRDEEWKEEMIANIGIDSWNSEFEFI